MIGKLGPHAESMGSVLLDRAATEREEKALKAKIDAMSRIELCRHWRFAESGDPLLSGVVGDYFVQKLKESGGFSPEISKRLGWRL